MTRPFAAVVHPARLPGLHFRRVAETDWDFLARVYAESRAEELAPVPWPDAAKAAFLRQQFDAQRLHYDTHYQGADLWVVEVDGTPVGRVYVYESASEFRLMDIALLNAYRGQGIGRSVLSELLAVADAAGRAISLHVEPENRVRAYYESVGFEHVEDRGAYVFMRRAARPLS